MRTSPACTGTNGRTARSALSYRRISVRVATASGRWMVDLPSLARRDGHRERRDRLAGADRAHAVVRLRFDAHVLRRGAERLGDARPHRAGPRVETRGLGDDRRVDGSDAPASLA